MPSADDIIRRWGREQHGLVVREQVLDAGLASSTLGSYVRTGELDRLYRGIFAFPSVPATWYQRILAAVFSAGPGAMAGHATAAALWELADIKQPPRVQLIVPSRRRRGVSYADLHVVRGLTDADRRSLNRIPVTSPARTFVDMASRHDIRVIEDLAIEIVRRRLASIEDLLDAAARAPRSPNVGLVKAVLATFDPEQIVRLMTRLEAAMYRALKNSPLPLPDINRVLDLECMIARVDAHWSQGELSVEADGLRWHSTPSQKRYDDERQNELILAGKRVLRYGSQVIFQTPDVMVRDVARALGITLF